MEKGRVRFPRFASRQSRCGYRASSGNLLRTLTSPLHPVPRLCLSHFEPLLHVSIPRHHLLISNKPQVDERISFSAVGIYKRGTFLFSVPALGNSETQQYANKVHTHGRS